MLSFLLFKCIQGGGIMMDIRKAVGAIVFQDNEYLLIHKVKLIDVSNKSISGF